MPGSGLPDGCSKPSIERVKTTPVLARIKARPILLMLVWMSTALLWGQPDPSENVVLVTFDGLRYQEVFSGLEPGFLDQKQQALKDQYWRSTAVERRRVLLPFFWDRFAPRGIVLGNREGGSQVTVANPHRFSYPGYAELLTGRVLPEIDSNDPVRIPVETILEFARRELSLQREQVAAFASWHVFNWITAQRADSIFSNAGMMPVPDRLAGPDTRLLNRLQREIQSPWDGVRHDAMTFRLALDYLKRHQPRFLYIALDETDEYAHAGQYDRYIRSIRQGDAYLEELWNTLQSLPGYRGRTTLIVTSDHGRGRLSDDWSSHGRDVRGAEFIWLAMVGPETPARGEVAGSETVQQRDIAATILRALGLDYRKYHSQAGPPIAAAFRPGD